MENKKKYTWTPEHIDISIKNLKNEDGYDEYEKVIKALGKM